MLNKIYLMILLEEIIDMNIIRVVIISSISLFYCSLQASGRCLFATQSVKTEWLKRRREGFDQLSTLLVKNRIEKLNGLFVYRNEVK